MLYLGRRQDMKLFICSDIHGSKAGLDKFLAAVEAEKQNGTDARIVILGDIYNHGPRNPFPEEYAPMQVAKSLNSCRELIGVVKGNCDSEVDRMISEFEIGADFFIPWEGRTLYFTHGHKCNPELERQFAKAGDVVFYGHFHNPKHTVKNGVNYVCVGALGISADGVPKAFATVENNRVTVINLDSKETIIEFYI